MTCILVQTSPKLAKPRLFHLNANYRSHRGILDCAHTIVQLIEHFWPNTIDALPEDTGGTHGGSPIFFRSLDGSGTDHEKFFFGQPFVTLLVILKRVLTPCDSGNEIELGADQCKRPSTSSSSSIMALLRCDSSQ